MDDQNVSSGGNIIYHIPTQAPFITHCRSGWHPVWDFCFPQHRFWGFGSSGLIHWVAVSLIHDVSKECTAFFDHWSGKQYISSKHSESVTLLLFFFGGATARSGPWPPLQYASKPLNPLLYLSIHLFPSFSGPWTHHPAISFLVLLHTAFRTSFLELWCLAFFLYDQAIAFFGL